MRGEHEIDFRTFDLPPLSAGKQARWHCASYATTWKIVSARCADLGEVLIDTTAAAIQDHREQHPERYAAVPTNPTAPMTPSDRLLLAISGFESSKDHEARNPGQTRRPDEIRCPGQTRKPGK